MLRVGSFAKAADNSGAINVKIVGTYGYSQKKILRISDVVKVTVKKAKPDGTAKKGEMYKAVIVRVRKEIKRDDGTYIRFDDNAVVMLHGNTKDPMGSRIFGPVARELKAYGFDKITYLAPEVL